MIFRFILRLFLCVGFESAPALFADGFTITREVMHHDAGAIITKAGWQDPGSGPLQAEGWAEYVFEAPAAGWYGLYFQNMPALAREVFVDGRRVSLALG